MDCGRCAEKVRRAAESAGAVDPHVSLTSGELSFVGPEEAVVRAVEAAGYGIQADAHRSPAYVKALWGVVLINLGYGVIEAIGGFLSGSQALKADALDFLGDGGITLLSVLAVGWAAVWRSRVALAQGIFLGVLGIGVVVTTVWRILNPIEVEAFSMGAFAVGALVANLAAAGLLIPHRKGDAGVRAVWLFSFTDAAANVCVLIAAGLVAWLGSAWPDWIVAVAIAVLFLHPAWVIVRDARRELALAQRIKQ